MTVPDANVRATFSESINPSTTDPTTFTLVRMGTATSVGAVVSYDSAAGKAVLDPSGELVSGAAYAATVKGGNGGVQDPAGNTLAVDKVWMFTVADLAKPGGTALINNGATYTKAGRHPSSFPPKTPLRRAK